MANGVHVITAQFEKELCKYTGAPFAIALDNASNAIFLALYYELNVIGDGLRRTITIPSKTYPSVPCEIIHAGHDVNFRAVEAETITGAYNLVPTKVWDSALRFTHDMYIKGMHMCLSFTGPYKHLKLGKGGAIITDNEAAYKWFKKARFSGRDECSYYEDNFDINPVIGWNFYMPVETATRGLHMIQQFYKDGLPVKNENLSLKYPDLSKFECYKPKINV